MRPAASRATACAPTQCPSLSSVSVARFATPAESRTARDRTAPQRRGYPRIWCTPSSRTPPSRTHSSTNQSRNAARRASISTRRFAFASVCHSTLRTPALARLDKDRSPGREGSPAGGLRVQGACGGWWTHVLRGKPALVTALRSHVEAMKLEGQVKGWSAEQRQLVFPNKAGRVMQLQHLYRGRLGAVARQSRAALSEVPRHPPHVRHVAPRGRHRPPLGTESTRPRHHSADGRHLRPRPAGAPRSGGEQLGSVPHAMRKAEPAAPKRNPAQPVAGREV